jgi:hypothetical protein
MSSCFVLWAFYCIHEACLYLLHEHGFQRIFEERTILVFLLLLSPQFAHLLHRTRKHLLYFKPAFSLTSCSSVAMVLYFPVVINHYFYSKLNHVCFFSIMGNNNFHSIYLFAIWYAIRPSIGLLRTLPSFKSLFSKVCCNSSFK